MVLLNKIILIIIKKILKNKLKVKKLFKNITNIGLDFLNIKILFRRLF